MNYEEKVTHSLSPFTIVNRYPEIEDKLFHHGMGNMRTAVTQLRNRYVLTHTTSGILRFETLEKACLSDFLCTYIKKEDDVHPLMVMITQVFTGKTNDTRTIFGRATRHKDVRLCPIGALAFYLALRFHITKEFSDLNPDFFLRNENWFNIRLLANAYGNRPDHTYYPLKNDSYSKSIRGVLIDLGLPHQKLKHLGRGLGTKILEADDVQAEYIRQLGNWNLNATDSSYSAKLPMQPIRNAAGFVQGNGLYCNPRTALPIPDELLSLSPLGNPFLDAHERVKLQVQMSTAQKTTPQFTSLVFLNFMKELNCVFFQDAAAMIVKHPERQHHPLYQLPCLTSTHFREYVENMRCHLDTSTNPYDASMELVMPGVQERFNGLMAVVRAVESSVNRRVESSMGGVESSLDNIRAAVNKLTEIAQLQMDAFHAAVTVVTRSHTYESHVLGTNTNTNTTVQAESAQQRATVNRTPTFIPIRIEPTQMANPTTQNDVLPTLPSARLSQRFASLALMWDEWHGTGGDATQDKPIPGGFAQLEQLYKSKWRKHLDGAQGRHVTRIRLIIDGIKKRAEMLNITVEESRDQLELEWCKGKKSPDALIRYLQEIGYTKKTKPRGKVTRAVPDINEAP